MTQDERLELERELVRQQAADPRPAHPIKINAWRLNYDWRGPVLQVRKKRWEDTRAP